MPAKVRLPHAPLIYLLFGMSRKIHLANLFYLMFFRRNMTYIMAAATQQHACEPEAGHWTSGTAGTTPCRRTNLQGPAGHRHFSKHLFCQAEYILNVLKFHSVLAYLQVFCLLWREHFPSGTDNPNSVSKQNKDLFSGCVKIKMRYSMMP